ncbi:U6 snRNP-associated protein Lsm7 [Tilletia horrida]|nr:U6 snRNP-associated protein Lsm7 [Tilletia horrida]
MADRGSYRGGGAPGRGGGGGGRGGNSSSSRGSGPGRGGGGAGRGRGGHHHNNSHSAGTGGPQGPAAERPKREAILDLSKYSDKQIRVKLAGGREVLGTLKGFDQLMNLVMDDVEELIKDPVSGLVTDEKRKLGLVVLRGTAITVINPADGLETIENPFAQAQ